MPLLHHATEVEGELNISDVSFKEQIILDFSYNKNGPKMTLVLNSVLSYVAKCISNKLKMSDISKFIKDFYNETDINHAWKLSRSFLQKKDRPKRQIGNY